MKMSVGKDIVRLNLSELSEAHTDRKLIVECFGRVSAQPGDEKEPDSCRPRKGV